MKLSRNIHIKRNYLLLLIFAGLILLTTVAIITFRIQPTSNQLDKVQSTNRNSAPSTTSLPPSPNSQILLSLLPPSMRLHIEKNLMQNESSSSISLFETQVASDPAPYIDEEEWRFVEIINAHRASLGRVPLKQSLKLTKAAEWMSIDTAARGFLPADHSDSLGRSAQQRFAAFGYTAPGGENIANSTSAQAAFDAWMQSPGHRQNMEMASFRAMGIARAKTPNNRYIWTNTFGSTLDTEITRETNPTPTPTNSPTPSPTPTHSPTPTVTPTKTPTPTPSPTIQPGSPTATPIKSPTPTPSPTGSPQHACGTISLPSEEEQNSQLQCMIDNASICKPSKALLNIDVEENLGGYHINPKIEIDFKKTANNSCTLHLKTGELQILKFPDGMSEEEKEAAREEFSEFEGKEGQCKFSNNQGIVNYFTKIKNGDFFDFLDSSSENYVFKDAQCQGTYFDLTNPTPTPTQSPSNTTILLVSVKLPGIGNGSGENNDPKNQTRPVTVKTFDSNDELVYERTSTMQYGSVNGRYNFTIQYGDEMEEGSYTHTVATNNSLFRKIPGFFTHTPGTEKRIPISITLATGDVDQDNALTVKDYTSIVGCYKNLSTCTAAIKLLADLNDNGLTKDDIKDFVIMQSGFLVREGD